MPKEISDWQKFKRSVGYIQAFTIGISAGSMGGRVYHQKVHQLYKKGDADFAASHNHYFNNYWKFMEYWIGKNGDKLPGHDDLISMVVGYFAEHDSTTAKVNVVLRKNKTPKSVEIRGLNGNWVTVWHYSQS